MKLSHKEIIVLSIILGTILGLIIGYIFGEAYYYLPNGKRINHQNDNTIEVFRNFLKENKEKSLFSLSENIKNVYSLINPVISDHEIKVIFDLNDDIYVYNYSNELTQALINILNNACDAINMKLKKLIFIICLVILIIAKLFPY